MKYIHKLVIVLIIFIGTYLSVNAQSMNTSVRYQKGYVKKDGTYVQGHYKTRSNKTNHDNYSTQSNINPYTKKSGERAKDFSKGAYNYGQGKTRHTGPKGGQYYINNKRKKVYIPKSLFKFCSLK